MGILLALAALVAVVVASSSKKGGAGGGAPSGPMTPLPAVTTTKPAPALPPAMQELSHAQKVAFLKTIAPLGFDPELSGGTIQGRNGNHNIEVVELHPLDAAHLEPELPFVVEANAGGSVFLLTDAKQATILAATDAKNLPDFVYPGGPLYIAFRPHELASIAADAGITLPSAAPGTPSAYNILGRVPGGPIAPIVAHEIPHPYTASAIPPLVAAALTPATMGLADVPSTPEFGDYGGAGLGDYARHWTGVFQAHQSDFQSAADALTHYGFTNAAAQLMKAWTDRATVGVDHLPACGGENAFDQKTWCGDNYRLQFDTDTDACALAYRRDELAAWGYSLAANQFSTKAIAAGWSPSVTCPTATFTP
jgi:hypothetical protein